MGWNYAENYYDIPGGYKLIRIGSGGEGEKYQYWHSDSSMIYLSDASGLGLVNDQSVCNHKENYGKKSSDSMLIKGVNNNGNYWIENIKDCCVVTLMLNQKLLFDSALNSMKYKY